MQALSKLKNHFFVLSCMLLLFSSSPLKAIWQPPVMVSDPALDEFTAGGGNNLAVNRLNNAVVVWGGGSGLFTDVRTSSFTFGLGWTPPLTISDPDNYYITGDQNVNLNDSGYAVAVWRGADQLNGVLGVFAATRDSSGNWSPLVRVSNYDLDIDFQPDKPKVALNEDGLAVMVWMEARDFGNTIAGFVMSSYLEQGGSWTSPVTIAGPYESAFDIVIPSISINSNGDAVAAWKSKEFGGTFLINAAAIFDGATKVWGPAFEFPPGFNRDNLGSFNMADAGIDENGNAVVVWTWEDLGTTTIVYGASYVNGVWGPSIPIFSQRQTTNPKPHVVVDQFGNATAIWEFEGDIFASSLPFGGIWSPPVIISDPNKHDNAVDLSYFPKEMDVDDNGNVIIIYVEDFFQPTNSPMSVMHFFNKPNWELPERIATQRTSQFFNIGLGTCGFALATWMSTTPDGRDHVWSAVSLSQNTSSPCDFKATRCAERFPTQTSYFNRLSWSACNDTTCILYYNIYRNGTLIATIPGGATSFNDPSCRGYAAYSITAVNLYGFESPPATIVLQ